MSTRAYLIKNIDFKHVNDEFIITKTLKDTPTFNITRYPEIFDLFRQYGQDNTNDDCIGEISISKNSWQHVLNKFHKNHEIISKITEDFQDSEFVIYECH